MSDSSEPGWLENFDSGWLGSGDIEKWEQDMLRRLEMGSEVDEVDLGEVDEGQGW